MTKDASAGSKNIDIFLRLRPTPRPSEHAEIDDAENTFAVNVPKDLSRVYVNNARERYEFRFTGVLGTLAKQDEVYERVARRAVTSSLEGYNSTVFAYGQTGSGKTFTLTGGPERYSDRGIIPRAISATFAELGRRTSSQTAVHVSYMEIYNEKGYDLLDAGGMAQGGDAAAMMQPAVQDYDELPRVRFLEDEAGHFHFTNLSAHRAASEEEALSLLFLGDTNRAIRETPMNLASTRSHCIFSISLEAHTPGEDTVRRSKLNLVDLAGSERMKKTSLGGQGFTEATYINGSLHFLEMVIVALQEKSMGHGDAANRHVPYRNSLLTCVLRDSLGGNCHTAMVATASLEDEHLDETISTCKFAQRVAMVRNTAILNEELDPALVIKRLRQEVRELKEELRLARDEEEDRGPLTEGELDRIREGVEAYAFDTKEKGDVPLPSTKSMQHIRAAFEAFKTMVGRTPQDRSLTSGAGNATASMAGGITGTGEQTLLRDGKADMLQAHHQETAAAPRIDPEVLKKLQVQLQQRDNEIGILVGMLKRRDGELMVSANTHERAALPAAVPVASGTPAAGLGATETSSSSTAPAAAHEELTARTKAFEMFRKSYRKNEATEEKKAELRQRYAEAKSLGEAVNASRARIQGMKSIMEQRRILRAVDGEGANAAADAEEDRRLTEDMLLEKAAYRSSFERLKVLKNEILGIQKILEQSRLSLQADFERWYGATMRKQTTSSSPQRAGSIADVPKENTARLNASFSSRVPTLLSTGNKEADDDIAAFYKARDEMLQQNRLAPVPR